MRYISPFLAALIFFASIVHSAEFRSFSRIMSPGPLPEGAVLVSNIKEISKDTFEKVFRKIANNYIDQSLETNLDDDFNDKQRLMDVIAQRMPRDTKLKVLSIRSVETMSQYTMTDARGRTKTVSKVAGIVRTRIEFNHPTVGFRAIEGTNEYIMNVVQRGGA